MKSSSAFQGRGFMDICFECGGKLQLISKAGRMAWDGDELYEIPVELKISTCLDCGQSFEDSFVKQKIVNAVSAQKRLKPNPRLLQLRWIDNFIDTMLKQPKVFGNKAAIYCQVILLLKFRELLLSKGVSDKSKEIQKSLRKFLQKQWPNLGSATYPKDVSLEDELAPVLKEFCDIWINT